VPGLHLGLPFRAVHPKVVPYADVVPNPVLVEKTQPLLPDKLSIRQQAVDAIRSEPVHEVPHQGNPVRGMGVSALIEHPKHEGEGHVLVADPQHQDVDAVLPQLPVGTVHNQN